MQISIFIMSLSFFAIIVISGVISYSSKASRAPCFQSLQLKLKDDDGLSQHRTQHIFCFDVSFLNFENTISNNTNILLIKTI